MQPEILLKGFEPYGAVALVSLGLALIAGYVVLRWLLAQRDVRLAKITARKELELAKLRQGSQP